MNIIEKLDRAHRMSCSDPDDPSKTTLYAEARDALRAAQLRVLSVSELMSATPDLDLSAACDAVAAMLDTLPDDALVQVVEVNHVRPDWTIRQRSYYERSGQYWTLLDPSDRNDGEDAFDSRQVAAASVQYGMARREGGFIRVLFVPDDFD